MAEEERGQWVYQRRLILGLPCSNAQDGALLWRERMLEWSGKSLDIFLPITSDNLGTNAAAIEKLQWSLDKIAESCRSFDFQLHICLMSNGCVVDRSVRHASTIVALLMP